MELHRNIALSPNHCGHCGGDAPDWKCPKCRTVSKTFDPRHFMDCPEGGKLQPLCAACQQAESLCTCAA